MLPDLPELILCLICEHLSYEDLFVLRCVCKGLKQFVDGREFIKFTKLNLFVEAFPYHRRLFYTNQPIGHPHSLHSNNTSILRTKKFRKRFCNVQRMIICHMEENLDDFKKVPKFDLASLNCFKRLTHLEINEVGEINGRLSLEGLRIASFGSEFCSGSSIELDCPKLEALRVVCCNLTLTDETNELHYLYGFDLYDEEDQLTRLYPNLQKLSTICFILLQDLIKFLSDLRVHQPSLPSLVRIGLEECNDLAKWDELANSLEDLKRNSHTRHIQFTLNGRPISSPEELRQMLRLVRAHDFGKENVGEHLNFSKLMDNSLQFLNENPTLDSLLPAVYTVELHEDTKLDEELIKKLENIMHLQFRWKCKPTEYQFELFAKHCKSLNFLSLYHLTVTERLLTMLSKHMVNLTLIKIHECKCQTVKPLGTFRNLSTVSLDFDPQRDELAFLFKNSRTLKELTVLGNPSVDLMRISTRREKFKIKIGDNRSVRFDSLDAMIGHLNANWLFRKFNRHNPS